MGAQVGKASAFDMNALDSRIRELVAYARERDGEDRTTLFRNLVDLFLTGKAPMREPTRSQLLDVIEALLPHVDSESRRTVSDLLASQTTPPMDLVLRICRDRASLCEGLLQNAPFDEDDIISLIQETGREHHQVLATRGDLSANVWIALARAAPAAPPFDSRSTLALWRDDLGAHGNTAGSAKVTALRPEKTASLRILRTDEDLIAERVTHTNSARDTRMVEAANDEPEADLAETTAPETALPETGVSDDVDHANEKADASGSTPAPTPAPAPDDNSGKKPSLKDPGPGGWAWRSDRDGLITGVSPQGCKLLGSVDAALGMGMLDLLGLNTKLGHPVSRAFQRRSTIHDAPIHLPDLGHGHQHWTLDAAPVFSPDGGVFEGYEGVLTPVKPASDPLDISTEDDDPLFLDDPAPQSRRVRSSAAERPDVMQARLLEKAWSDENRARTPQQSAETVAEQPGGRHANEEQISHRQADETPASEKATIEKPTGSATHTRNEDRPSAPTSAITSMAAAMVRDVVSETLGGPMTPGEEIARYGSHTEQGKGSASSRVSSPAETTTTLKGNAEAAATIELLEQALLRLSEASKNGNVTQTRLQAEIAMACVRALKDQIT